MSRIELSGNCVNCGATCYAQSICHNCDKEVEEEPEYWCSYCEDAKVELEGQICEVCIETAHEDGKHFKDCPLCSNERDRERGER